LAWQDWIAMDEALRSTDISIEQINNPSVSRHYWRYRMHMTLEKLIDSTKFNNCVRELVKESGR
jgi:4-alpha-glucanotransferase